jgi:hypothetical protein
MMYSNKLVASLKANGKILREFKDTVYIPFGSEYSFLIKNLNTTRALVNIFIDGDNIVEGGLVLNAGQEVDLERAIRNNNLTEGNRFKFIERTAAIEDGPRGVKLEDGLIRIEFQFEKPRPVISLSQKWVPGHYEYDNHLTRGIWNTSFGGTTGISGGTGDRFSVTASGATSSMNINGALRGVDLSQNGAAMAQAASASVDKYCADNGIINKMEMHDGSATMDWNDVGITVPGSKSTQRFSNTTMGEMEVEKHSIVLKLLGETVDNKPVLQPVTVKHKPKCVTCGKVNKANAKFCTECGTALEIFA